MTTPVVALMTGRPTPKAYWFVDKKGFPVPTDAGDTNKEDFVSDINETILSLQ